MALKLPIFMDSQSTTPMDPRVLEAMLPYFTQKFGHPASRNHPFGWEAEAGVDKGREQIANLIGARDPKEIIFTSGGTESINLALKGVAEMYREKGNHILTTAIEQRASLDVCKRLTALRDHLQNLILSKVDEAFVNGHPSSRLPHNLNISFAYVEGESVLMGLNKESALSSGSACTSSTLEPSYVIAALGVDSELAHSSIRFGLHRFSTEEEVDFVGGRVVEVVHRLREMSPLYELAKEGVDLKSIKWKAE